MLGLQEEEETIGILLRKRAKVMQARGPEIESIDEQIMRKLLMRQENEFNRLARDKNFDPSELKILVSDVTKGYTTSDKSEQKKLQ